MLDSALVRWIHLILKNWCYVWENYQPYMCINEFAIPNSPFENVCSCCEFNEIGYAVVKELVSNGDIMQSFLGHINKIYK